MLSASDKRRFVRLPMSLPAKLFFSQAEPADCQVVNLSCAGAAIQCDEERPAISGVLYIEHLGRVAVIGRRNENGILGLEFDCTDRKRWELGMAIAQYMATGVTQLTRQRRRERMAVSDIYLTRPNGESTRCDAMNISSSGMSLKTTFRPPIGERINVQGMAARVVRHHANGVAIELVPAGLSTVVSFPSGPCPDSEVPPDLAG
jgi:hypothetical protein